MICAKFHAISPNIQHKLFKTLRHIWLFMIITLLLTWSFRQASQKIVIITLIDIIIGFLKVGI